MKRSTPVMASCWVQARVNRSARVSAPVVDQHEGFATALPMKQSSEPTKARGVTCAAVSHALLSSYQIRARVHTYATHLLMCYVVGW